MAVVESLNTPPFDGSTPVVSHPAELIPFPTEPTHEEDARIRFLVRRHFPTLEGDRLIGLPAAPKIEVPQRFRMLGIKGEVAREKGAFVEQRIAEIVATHPKVESVEINKRNGEQDNRGHDITVHFKEDTGIDPIHLQVKSGNKGVSSYKSKISRKLRELGVDMSSSEWLILDRTIAINGGAADEQSVLFAFVRGVARIIKLYDSVAMKHRYVDLFSEEQ